MNSEIISIIVVTYNSENTVLKTLDSIMNQTYSNIEIVITDDCSTDDTIEKVLEWKDKSYPGGKVKIIKSKINTGISENVNRGVNASIGDLVKIIAGDDTLERNAIEVFYKNYKKSEKNSEQIIYQSKVNLIDNNDQQTDKLKNYLIRSYNCISSKEQFHSIVKSNFLVAPAIGLLNKSIFKKYGYFDTRFPMLEDYPFYLNLSKNGFVFKLIDEALVNYRISSTSVSQSNKNRTKNRYLISYAKYNLYVRLWLMLKEGYIIQAIKTGFWSFKTLIVESLHH